MPIHERLQISAPPEPREWALVSLSVAAGHIEQAWGELCARHGVTLDQYNVLRILRGVHPAGHPRHEIARRLIRRAPDVTRFLDRLQRRGLVERVRSPDDARLSLSRITDDGMTLLAAMDGEMRALDRALTSALTGAEAETLATLCARLVP